MQTMTSNERRAAILDTIRQLEALREVVRARTEDGSLTVDQNNAATVDARALNVKLQTLLTDGADVCPSCDTPAFGLAHESATGKGSPIRYLYEIGCKNLDCRDHRATDLLPELAVERWNAGDYDAPRKGPAVAPGE